MWPKERLSLVVWANKIVVMTIKFADNSSTTTDPNTYYYTTFTLVTCLLHAKFLACYVTLFAHYDTPLAMLLAHYDMLLAHYMLLAHNDMLLARFGLYSEIPFFRHRSLSKSTDKQPDSICIHVNNARGSGATSLT
jgi:hypothetical protein